MHSPDLNPLEYSVWDILQELSTKEGESQRSSECYQRCHDVDDQTVRKAILQWKKRLAALAKQNGGPIQHIFC